MAKVDLIMPKMGESIMEATILKWIKKEGDPIEEDETILEIATDKVDSDIPAPISGVMGDILFKEDEVVEVGKVIAYILTEADTGEGSSETIEPKVEESTNGMNPEPQIQGVSVEVPYVPPERNPIKAARPSQANRFYSPLVRNIAAKENVGIEQLDSIQGTGLNGRVTKADLLNFLKLRESTKDIPSVDVVQPLKSVEAPADVSPKTEGPPATKTKLDEKTITTVSTDANIEIQQMDRMRKLIADHMINSKKTSAHVTSFVEADVTNLVNWREQIKDEFIQKHGQKITLTPIFVDAVVKAIQDFPKINASVDGDKIIIKYDIHIGMATALPNGNLIVPVIKNANHYNMVGLAKTVNDLAARARDNNLNPEDIQGGTFTLTNVGTFGNVMGTPIINQPQLAVLATGAIRKKPAVLETEHGDVIAVRKMMFLSLSYDHRVIDGFLGGSFLRRVADYLEAFNTEIKI